MPVLKTLAAAQMVTMTPNANTIIDAIISRVDMPELADSRNTMTIGVTGGTKLNTRASVPPGL
jgi:hypothetical protein